MQLIKSIEAACRLLSRGEVLAYPTEAVYGLGCDIDCEPAVLKILDLKKRPQSKGLVVLISDWAQLWPLIDKAKIPDACFDGVKKTWPGPVTWVFPKSSSAPQWVTGVHDGIAVRMTAHPIAHALCQNGPIVSTSANLAGCDAIRDTDALYEVFSDGIAGVVAGDLGDATSVSQIYDVLSGQPIRV